MKAIYHATKEDFAAMEEALEFVWQPRLREIFRYRNSIKSVVIISYDSQFVYLWSSKKLSGLTPLPCGLARYRLYKQSLLLRNKIPHRIKISEIYWRSWHANVSPEEIRQILPASIKNASDFAVPKISGGLLNPFIYLQKKLKGKNNPYTTRESYLAMIIHEFAHVYWNQHKLWWYSDKKENLGYIRLAKELYQQRIIRTRRKKLFLKIPLLPAWGEVFAFCTEYWASGLFWPSHRERLDKFIVEELSKLEDDEKKKDLDTEDSVIEPARQPHNFAFVFSKILLTYYPEQWSQVLLRSQTLAGDGGF